MIAFQKKKKKIPFFAPTKDKNGLGRKIKGIENVFFFVGCVSLISSGFAHTIRQGGNGRWG